MRASALSLCCLVLAAFFAACSGGDSSDAGNEASVAGAAADIEFGQTRFVAEPPVYEATLLPEGIEWVTNEDDPVFTSPDAKRGGTLNTYLTGFPLTLRTYGPDSNTGRFTAQKRSMQLSLTELHPNTINYVPSLATHWAFDPDGRTVYYRLDPRARWSDGEPVVADDYLFARELLISEHAVAPYYANYFTEEIVDIRKHDDHTISIVAGEAQPPAEILLKFNTAKPLPRHFHKLDENWVTDYNWRIEPTTGPYDITAVENGRFVEFTRKQDWWGDALKYNRNRFNVDRIRLEIIRDEDVAYEYFLRGELDHYLFDTLPARWHERARGPDFDRGYIHRIEYYTDQPREQRGLWLNTADPVLSDINVRKGLSHAFNLDRALRTVFRNDYQRMRQQYEGFFFGTIDTSIRAREFDIDLAGEYFDTAGWAEYGPDGIRTRNGQRLSVRIAYGTDDHTPWLVVVREEARKAGIELQLQLLDAATWGTQVGEKTFQALVLTFRPNSLTPQFWQGYYSTNAHIPNTNNITNTDIPELDRLIDAYDAATTLDERVPLAHQIQQMLHEHAPVVPLYKIPFIRETYWRWLRLPEHHSVRTANKVIDPIGSYPFVGGLYWIDEDIKAETLAAREAGRAFEPVDIVDTTWRADSAQ